MLWWNVVLESSHHATLLAPPWVVVLPPLPLTRFFLQVRILDAFVGRFATLKDSVTAVNERNICLRSELDTHSSWCRSCIYL